MNKKAFWQVSVVIVVLAVLAFVFLHQSKKGVAEDYKNATYLIDGQPVLLKDGVAETEAAPGSASKIVTRYFGNELKADLNNDGREDVVFLLTQQTGGSGTFYYVVAALNTDHGYVGSDGYLLGDRIAPQTTELSQNPSQKNVVVVNYMDRAPNEPMSTQPSVGKSVYLKLDPTTMQWGVVEPNSASVETSPTSTPIQQGTVQGTVSLGPVCPVEHVPPEPGCAPKPYQTTIRIQPANPSVPSTNIQSDASGNFSVSLYPGSYTFSPIGGNAMPPTCRAQQVVVAAGQSQSITLECDTGIR